MTHTSVSEFAVEMTGKCSSSSIKPCKLLSRPFFEFRSKFEAPFPLPQVCCTARVCAMRLSFAGFDGRSLFVVLLAGVTGSATCSRWARAERGRPRRSRHRRRVHPLSHACTARHLGIGVACPALSADGRSPRQRSWSRGTVLLGTAELRKRRVVAVMDSGEARTAGASCLQLP